MNKKDLTEADICDLFITPAVQQAGWDAANQIWREHYFTTSDGLEARFVDLAHTATAISASLLRIPTSEAGAP